MHVYVEVMAAANFSRDVLEMFYGPIEDNQRLNAPMTPDKIGEFEIRSMAPRVENAGHKEQQRPVQIFPKKRKTHS